MNEQMNEQLNKGKIYKKLRTQGLFADYRNQNSNRTRTKHETVLVNQILKKSQQINY